MVSVDWSRSSEGSSMARNSSTQPTDVEMVILRALWTHGPSSVRRIHELLQGSRQRGYSTTLKMMQVMFDKRLLLRDESQRPQIYRPAIPEEQTQRQIVRNLIEKVFGG